MSSMVRLYYHAEIDKDVKQIQGVASSQSMNCYQRIISIENIK